MPKRKYKRKNTPKKSIRKLVKTKKYLKSRKSKRKKRKKKKKSKGNPIHAGMRQEQGQEYTEIPPLLEPEPEPEPVSFNYDSHTDEEDEPEPNRVDRVGSRPKSTSSKKSKNPNRQALKDYITDTDFSELKKMDAYELLNLEKYRPEPGKEEEKQEGFSEDRRRNYNTLALFIHPDKESGNEEKFKIINWANETLSDNDKKRIYDRVFRPHRFGQGDTGTMDAASSPFQPRDRSAQQRQEQEAADAEVARVRRATFAEEAEIQRQEVERAKRRAPAGTPNCCEKSACLVTGAACGVLASQAPCVVANPGFAGAACGVMGGIWGCEADSYCSKCAYPPENYELGNPYVLGTGVRKARKDCCHDATSDDEPDMHDRV